MRMSTFKELLKRPVAYHSGLAKMLKSPTAAIMLSQGIYWQEKAEEKGEEWFYVTGEEWYNQTGLTPENQSTARALMGKRGFWMEERRGLPARLYYRIDTDELELQFGEWLFHSKNKFPGTTETGSGEPRKLDSVNAGNNTPGTTETNKRVIESKLKNKIKSSSSANEKFAVPPSPSEKPKKEKKGTPGAEPWTKEVATLFDQILKEKDPCSDPYNWIAAPGRDFSALKRLKAAMLPDIKRNAELKKQEVTPETITAGFSFLFSYGYDYLSEIAKSKGGPVHYTPSAILNNYNSIVNYAKRNHKPATATTTSSQRRADADREALARLVESAHDIDF